MSKYSAIAITTSENECCLISMVDSVIRTPSTVRKTRQRLRILLEKTFPSSVVQFQFQAEAMIANQVKKVLLGTPNYNNVEVTRIMGTIIYLTEE